MSCVEANTEAIIRLAWARALGLPDDALAAPASRAVAAAPEGADELRILKLFDATAMVGPAWMMERVANSSTDPGIAHSLSALGPGARKIVHEILGYRDDYAQEGYVQQGYAQQGPGQTANSDGKGPLVTHDQADLATLMARCPIDDVHDAAMRGLDVAFTMLDDDHRPIAAAAYRVEHGLLADVRALTDPDLRGRGHGAQIAELVIEDALDSGLIAQSRHHPASLTGARLTSALGFTAAGSLIVLSAGATG